MKFSKKKKMYGVTAAAAVVALMITAVALAADTFSGPYAPPLAGTNLHASQIGSSSTTFQQECKGDEVLADGEVLWHFVLVKTTAANTEQLKAEFATAGVTNPTITSYKTSGGVLHWNVITPGDDVLLNASTDAVGKTLNLSHVCGGGGENPPAAKASISTEIHSGATDSGDPVVIADGSKIDLGSTVHDSATVEFDPATAVAPEDSTVTFYFYSGDGCDDSIDGDPGDYLHASSPFDVSFETSPFSVDPALAQGPLGAGKYSYRAFFTSGNKDVVGDAMSDCEPFEVNKGTVTISTDIHNAAHGIVTSVASGSVVHDTTLFTGANANFPPTLTNVTFRFYSTRNDCYGSYTSSAATGADEVATARARSGNSPVLTPGFYSYAASFSGDSNYNAAVDAACEPLSVYQLGLTMGFWGNRNGIARINNAGGYVVNAVAFGRGSNIDTQAESAKVLPSTLNACGKGNPAIFTVGSSTSSLNCTLATGVNIGTLNTASAQTLALGYNIKLVSGYTGQTISQLGCGVYVITGLTGASTVQAAFAQAVALIDGSASGGATTQAQLGALNQLLGCLNREA